MANAALVGRGPGSSDVAAMVNASSTSGFFIPIWEIAITARNLSSLFLSAPDVIAIRVGIAGAASEPIFPIAEIAARRRDDANVAFCLSWAFIALTSSGISL